MFRPSPPTEPLPKPTAWKIFLELPEDFTIYTSEGEFYVKKGDIIILTEAGVKLFVPR